MRTKGTITTRNDGKVSGFFTPATGGNQVFVHIRAFGNRSRRPEASQLVLCAASFDTKGQARAGCIATVAPQVRETAVPLTAPRFERTA